MRPTGAEIAASWFLTDRGGVPARVPSTGEIAVSFAGVTVACGRTAPLQEGMEIAAEPTEAWTKASNAGDLAALAALYAEDARTLPPGGPPVVGRADIESYWRADLGEGNVTTTLVPVDAIAQGDLLQVEGTYQVTGGEGADVAGGQYQQLWARSGDNWQVQREMWRIDPALQRDPQVAERLTTAWTTAYNAVTPKRCSRCTRGTPPYRRPRRGQSTANPRLRRSGSAISSAPNRHRRSR